MRSIGTALGASLILWTSVAHADLKCGDAPYAMRSDELVVTWIGPVPSDAKVAYQDSDPFSRLEEVVGPEVPRDYPKKYLADLQRVKLYNANMSWNIDQVIDWQGRYEIKMFERPIELFKNYLDSDHLIFSTLIEHPFVDNAPSFTACSVVLQRGIIIFDGENETLFLRSYFRSSTEDGQQAVNFVPEGGLRIEFESDGVWFPIALTEVIFEPESYLMLDILTTEPIESGKVLESFNTSHGRLQVDNVRSQISFQGKEYHVTRVSGALPKGESYSDLNLRF